MNCYNWHSTKINQCLLLVSHTWLSCNVNLLYCHLLRLLLKQLGVFQCVNVIIVNTWLYFSTVSLTKTTKKGLESKQNLIEEVSMMFHRSFGWYTSIMYHNNTRWSCFEMLKLQWRKKIWLYLTHFALCYYSLMIDENLFSLSHLISCGNVQTSTNTCLCSQ